MKNLTYLIDYNLYQIFNFIFNMYLEKNMDKSLLILQYECIQIRKKIE